MLLFLMACVLVSSTVDAAWDASNETYKAIQRTILDLETYVKMPNASSLKKEIAWPLSDLDIIQNDNTPNIDRATLAHAVKVVTKYANGTLEKFFEAATYPSDPSKVYEIYTYCMVALASVGILVALILILWNQIRTLNKKIRERQNGEAKKPGEAAKGKEEKNGNTAATSETPAASVGKTPKSVATPTQTSKEKVESKEDVERAAAKGDNVEKTTPAQKTSKEPSTTGASKKADSNKGDSKTTRSVQQPKTKNVTREEMLRKFYKDELKREIVSEIDHRDDNHDYFKYIETKHKMKYMCFKACVWVYAAMIALLALAIVSASVHIYLVQSDLTGNTNPAVNSQITQLKRDLLYGLRNPTVFDRQINQTVTDIVLKAAAINGISEAAQIFSTVQNEITSVNDYMLSLRTVEFITKNNNNQDENNDVHSSLEEIVLKIKDMKKLTGNTTENYHYFEELESHFTKAYELTRNEKLILNATQGINISTYMSTVLNENMFKIQSFTEPKPDTRYVMDKLIVSANSFDEYYNHANTITSKMESNIFYFSIIAGLHTLPVIAFVVMFVNNRSVSSIWFFLFSIVGFLIAGGTPFVGSLVLTSNYQGGCNYLLNGKETLINVSFTVFNITNIQTSDLANKCDLRSTYANVFSEYFEALLDGELLTLNKEIESYANKIVMKSDTIAKIDSMIQEAEVYHSILDALFRIKMKCQVVYNKEHNRNDFLHAFTCENTNFTSANSGYTDAMMKDMAAAQVLKLFPPMMNALNDSKILEVHPYKDFADSLRAAKSPQIMRKATRSTLMTALKNHRATLKTIFNNAYDIKCGLTTIYENMVHAVCDPFTYPHNAMQYIMYLVAFNSFLLSIAFLLAGVYTAHAPVIQIGSVAPYHIGKRVDGSKGSLGKKERLNGADITHKGPLTILDGIPTVDQRHLLENEEGTVKFAKAELGAACHIAYDIGYEVEQVIPVGEKSNPSSVNNEERTFYYNLLVEHMNFAKFKDRKGMDYTNEVLDRVLRDAKARLEKGRALAELAGPCVIVGDIHGQYEDLLRIFNLFNTYEDEANKQGGVHGIFTRRYLFLGDYVDRGYRSLECVVLLFTLKMLYPDQFVLLRGNHEIEGVNNNYGLGRQLRARYAGDAARARQVFDAMNDAFAHLPVAAVVGGKILCMHGGICPGLTLEQINNIALPIPYDAKTCLPDLANHLTWADPTVNLVGVKENSRGVSICFGEDTLEDVLKRNQLDMVVRGHQSMASGFGLFGEGRLVSVFSAPAYERDVIETGEIKAYNEGRFIIKQEYHEIIGAVLDVNAEGKVGVCFLVPAYANRQGEAKFVTYLSKNNEYRDFAIIHKGVHVQPSIPCDSVRQCIDDDSVAGSTMNASKKK